MSARTETAAGHPRGRISLGSLLTLLFLCLACCPAPTVDRSWIEYPPAQRVAQVDSYYGVEVADPYRWLEAEASADTQAWLAVQDDITERFFSELPVRAEVLAYLEENWHTGAIGLPVRRGDRTFFWELPEGSDHPILYMQRLEGPVAEPLFDLNSSDPADLLSTLPVVTASPEGRYVSYEIHRAGADMAEFHVYDTEAGSELDEVIPESFSSITSWLPDESGFYYTWVDEATLFGRSTDKPAGIYRHRIGSPVEQDELVYGRPWNGMFMALGIVAEDEKHLLIHYMNVMGGRGGWGARSIGGDEEVTWLIDPEPHHRFAYVGSRGSEVFLITDHQAPNWRIVAASLDEPGIENLREVVAEQEAPISMVGGSNAGVVLHDERLYVTYIHHNAHEIRVFDVDGVSSDGIELPLPGSVSVSGIETQDDDPVLHIALTSFLEPQAVYAYDTASEGLRRLSGPAATSFEDFEVSRIFYESADGTSIPMSILHGRETAIDGEAKVLLYGYGGWGIPLMPGFSNRIHAWLRMGGIYAVANLRGGVEYGEAWHQAGQLLNKQNVFDDFAAAAEYLVAEGYTTAGRITILGASNGGLLTAASYNQRPELFGAVISEVAAVDLLRLPETPVGATQTVELGAPSTSEEMFEYLLGYSPLHNVRHEGPYPPILHIVGENDPRCKPGHIYKYVAEMQQTDPSQRLAILRVVRGAGHGSSRKADNVAWIADEIAFAWAMTE